MDGQGGDNGDALPLERRVECMHKQRRVHRWGGGLQSAPARGPTPVRRSLWGSPRGRCPPGGPDQGQRSRVPPPFPMRSPAGRTPAHGKSHPLSSRVVCSVCCCSAALGLKRRLLPMLRDRMRSHVTTHAAPAVPLAPGANSLRQPHSARHYSLGDVEFFSHTPLLACRPTGQCFAGHVNLTKHAHHIGSILDCFHAQNCGEYCGCLSASSETSSVQTVNDTS